MQYVAHLFTSGLMISIFSLFNAFSQSALTGGLTGVITDPNGALVSNITVEITRTDGEGRAQHLQRGGRKLFGRAAADRQLQPARSIRQFQAVAYRGCAGSPQRDEPAGRETPQLPFPERREQRHHRRPALRGCG